MRFGPGASPGRGAAGAGPGCWPGRARWRAPPAGVFVPRRRPGRRAIGGIRSGRDTAGACGGGPMTPAPRRCRCDGGAVSEPGARSPVSAADGRALPDGAGGRQAGSGCGCRTRDRHAGLGRRARTDRPGPLGPRRGGGPAGGDDARDVGSTGRAIWTGRAAQAAPVARRIWVQTAVSSISVHSRLRPWGPISAWVRPSTWT